MGENQESVELHGCIVCGRLYNLLVVRDSQASLVGCVVTSPGGHRVYDVDHPLVACNDHPEATIEAAYERFRAARLEDTSGEDG